MRNGFCAIAVLALVGVAADLALGHGGTYTGPSGGGTPTFGGPAGGSSGGGSGGTTGGGGGGGGTTPGAGAGGGGTTPGGGGAAPPRPGGGGGRGAGGRGGATGGRSKPKNDTREHDWDWWWELNDDQYLKIKAAIRSQENASSEADAIFGKSDGNAVSKVTNSLIRKDILPVVRTGMADSFFDARAGAVIAAGKIVGTDFAEMPEVVAEMKKLLADSDTVVRESACLGLGILGWKESIPDLLSIMRNEVKARALTGQGTKDIYVRQRAFAAIAVGLIGAQDAVDAPIVADLVAQLKKNEPHPDLRVFPALALGIMRSKDAVPAIQVLVKNLEEDPIVRAHSVIALGKLGDKGSVDFLVKDGLTDKDTHVQRSSAIALGLLTDREDDKTVSVLMNHAKSAADRAVRNFAIIALGQIGNTKGRDHLVQMVKKGQQHDRTFAALALGVYGNKWKEDKAELGELLLAAWKDTKSDSERGAYAIAMGLLDYKSGAPALLDELKAGGSPQLKGHVATALGLMGEKSAIPLIQDLAKNMSDLDAQRRASIALGLIGDPLAVKILSKVIEDAGNNLSALGGAAVALGFIGDRSAVPVMSDLLTNREAKDNARAFAAVALGILGDKSDLPMLSKVQENCNYLATTDSLNEILLIY